MRRNRKIEKLAVVTLLTLTLAACGSNKPEVSGDNNDSQVVSNNNGSEAEGVDTNNESGTIDNSKEPPVSSNSEQTPSEATPDPVTEPQVDLDVTKGDVLQGSGIYVGQNDSNSIEVTTADGATAFQIEDAVAQVVDTLEEGSTIKFEYYEKTTKVGSESVKQLFMTKIVK